MALLLLLLLLGRGRGRGARAGSVLTLAPEILLLALRLGILLAIHLLWVRWFWPSGGFVLGNTALG